MTCSKLEHWVSFGDVSLIGSLGERPSCYAKQYGLSPCEAVGDVHDGQKNAASKGARQ